MRVFDAILAWACFRLSGIVVSAPCLVFPPGPTHPSLFFSLRFLVPGVIRRWGPWSQGIPVDCARDKAQTNEILHAVLICLRSSVPRRAALCRQALSPGLRGGEAGCHSRCTSAGPVLHRSHHSSTAPMSNSSLLESGGLPNVRQGRLSPLARSELTHSAYPPAPPTAMPSASPNMK